jgi:hypothetical protein
MADRPLPYANATSGDRARAEIMKILRRLGCEQIGFMGDFNKHEVLLAFIHRGRSVQFPVSAKGWAAMWLRKNPWNDRMRRSRHEYEQAALQQGHVVANSMLRDWVKGNVTAVESGILSFEAVFLSHMLTNDGRPLIERIGESNLLPAPADNIVSLGERHGG